MPVLLSVPHISAGSHHKMKDMWNPAFLLLNLILIISCSSDPVRTTHEECQPQILRKLLQQNILHTWYPHSVDTLYGGFLADFSYNWEPSGPQNKMIVTQTRHIWTTSQAFMLLQDSVYLALADHGFEFIKEKMWDSLNGGFYFILSREGVLQNNPGDFEKSAYGNAFAIYALTGYYKASGNVEALELAKKTFNWLEKYSHDPLYGGYFDLMHYDGSLYTEENSLLRGLSLQQRQWKDYNSSIHLLEAFSELYSVWPDSLLRKRTNEMLCLVRDTLIDPRGFLNLYFIKDWKHISYRDSTEQVRKRNSYYDHVSFGHDVETAYLILEASHELGLKNDQRTLDVAKNLIDHALRNGWDDRYGGFFDAGYYYKDEPTLRIISRSKIWWAEAEELNALLMLSQEFPDQPIYRVRFREQWNYITTWLIDHERGDWYPEGIDRNPVSKWKPKASVWKINYHNTRTLINCIHMLEEETPIPVRNGS